MSEGGAGDKNTVYVGESSLLCIMLDGRSSCGKSTVKPGGSSMIPDVLSIPGLL